MSFFSWNAFSANPLDCVTMNNQECKIRSGIINVTVLNIYFILLVFL